MGDHSTIEWTEATWNPTTGCDRVSAGCDHCYAMTLAKRLKAMGSAKYQQDGDPRTSGPGFRLTLHPSALDIPKRWRSPRTIFVNSMSDLFHEDVPLDFIKDVFAVMRETRAHRTPANPRPPHTWIVIESEGRAELGRSGQAPPSHLASGAWTLCRSLTQRPPPGLERGRSRLCRVSCRSTRRGGHACFDRCHRPPDARDADQKQPEGPQ